MVSDYAFTPDAARKLNPATMSWRAFAITNQGAWRASYTVTLKRPISSTILGKRTFCMRWLELRISGVRYSKTLAKFAATEKEFVAKHGGEPVARKITYAINSNRPFAGDMLEAFRAASTGQPALSAAAEPLSVALRCETVG